MRTLITGFIAFALWATLSTYVYVCRVQGLCSEPISLQAATPPSDNEMLKDTAPVAAPNVAASYPKNLLNYFEFDKSDYIINDLTKKYYTESTLYLNENPNAKLMITGHADAVGTEKYNLALGFRRAKSVKQYLTNAGVPAEKISIASKGESQPADNNSTSEGRANNRRTEISIKK